MWERERFNKDVKKEETKGEEVKMEVLEKEIDTPLNLDQDIIKVSFVYLLMCKVTLSYLSKPYLFSHKGNILMMIIF